VILVVLMITALYLPRNESSEIAPYAKQTPCSAPLTT
jgi:hypothetical protein